MLLVMYLKVSKARANLKVSILAFVLAAVPAVGTADIIWSGDFSTGDFTQWHESEGPPPASDIQFHHMPAYGRPIQYGWQNPIHIGNSDLMSLVAATARTVDGVSYPQGPPRGSSEYAVKMTVKSLAGGGVEPDDCDHGLCTRRRTALSMQTEHSDYYDALPYGKTRWFSCSMYLPSNYILNTSGWGGVRCGLKPRNESGGGGNSPAIDIALNGGQLWKITNKWINKNPLPELSDVPWQHQMFYAGNEEGGPYPRSDFWAGGLAHFPDVATSQAALQSVNIGGWTDWIIQMRADSRGAGEGGQGFMKVWKREDDGPWVFVLDISPGTTTRGGMTFDHGIGYDVRSTSNNGGYGLLMQFYMDKDHVWNDPRNKVAYYANIKIGDENATFDEMAPDGTSIEQDEAQTKPLPPTFVADP